jgi:hypothetical protein
MQTGTFSNVFDFVLYETFSHAADDVCATAKTDRFDQYAIIVSKQMSVEQTRRLWFGEWHEVLDEAGDTLILAPICPLAMRQDVPTISLANASDHTATPFRREPAPARNSWKRWAMSAGFYLSGQKVPSSGIYQVRHKKHRLPHQVTLLRDQQFPPCARCGNAVQFKVIRLVDALDERRGKIILNVLPVIDDDQRAA